MQDQRYDELRQMLRANAEKGIDERIKELIRNDSDELEELMEREHLREDLQPKYVIVKNGPLYEFRARYVDMHRTLLSEREIRDRLCDGGGFWGVNGEKRLVTLYDSSSDFGFPKHIEEAIQQDGHHLLKILERICSERAGALCNFSGYEISYMDRQHERHFVDYLSAEEAGKMKYEMQTAISREIDEAYQKRLSREDYERFGLCRNYTPPSPVNKKKRKAKAKAQKQSRRKNRKH